MKTSKVSFRNCVVYAALLVLGAAQAVQPSAAGSLAAMAEKITPHRAAYELKLVQVTSGSQIVHAEGFMSYDWLRRCDGWTSDQRLFLVMNYPENRTVNFKVVSVSWESEDGLRFRFNVKRDGLEQEIERIVGEAKLSRIGGPGEVTYEFPKSKKLKLPVGTIFPNRHTLHVLNQAAEGARFDRQLVFDGTELKGAAPVTTIFLSQQPKVELPKPVEGYTPKPVYPMRLAFFAPAGSGARQDALPGSEYKVLYQADGIAPRIFFNFGDFKLRGDMVGFKQLPKPEC